MSNDLLVIQTDSHAECLRLTNEVLNSSQAIVLELFSQGTCSHAILRGSFQEEIKNPSITKINNVHEKVLKAFLNIDLEKIKDGMTLVESENLGALFQACQSVIEQGAVVVDFRWFRGGQKKGYCITSPSQVTPKIQGKFSVQQLNDLNQQILDLYQPLY